MEPTTLNRTAGIAKAGSGEALVAKLMAEQASSMLATARRYSLCPDDAHDAWQRSLEILLRRASSLDPHTAAGWLRTVVKHEALAVRAERSRANPVEEFDPDQIGSGVETAHSRENFERIAAAAEALQRLKPAEAEAFMLLASGLSYREIADAKGWTYTKVNRLVTEGRKAFRLRVAGIESGDECTRWRASLTRIADGEATAEERDEVAPHLKRCQGCRALLRSDREAAASMAMLGPAFVIPAEAQTEAVSRTWGSLGRWLSDLPLIVGLRLQGAADAVAASKVAAVAATSVAIAGGGVALQQHQAHQGHMRVAPASVRWAPATTSGRMAAPGVQSSSSGGELASPAKPPSGDAGSAASRPGESASAPSKAEFDPLAGSNSSAPAPADGSNVGSSVTPNPSASKAPRYGVNQESGAFRRAVSAPTQVSSKTTGKSSPPPVEFGP